MENLSNELKKEFQKEYGCEDIFKVVAKIEVNGAKGTIRVTEFKDNGECVLTESNAIDALTSSFGSR